MRATSLLLRLLPYPRLSIDGVEFEADGTVIVRVRPRGKPRCPGCGQKRPIYDQRGDRSWRHLDFGQRRCFLRGPVRRVECRRCGVKTEGVSWAAPGSGFTKAFESVVGWLAQRTDKTTLSTLQRIAWRTVGAILRRVVDRHREPVDLSRLHAIGVDELSYRKGHRYLTLVTDLETGRIIWGAEGRSAETLKRFFEETGPEVRDRIRFVAMDLGKAYQKAVRESLPLAEIVFDRFHVQALISDAVDETRREEWRRTQGTPEGDAIKGSRYSLLKNPWNLTLRQEEVLADLQTSNRRLYRAYLLKEAFAHIYDQSSTSWVARVLLRDWLAWASRSQLPAFVKAAKTVRDHLSGILRYFDTGYSNGPAEGQNNKARLATRQAYGFHSSGAALAMIELRCCGIEIPLPR